MARRRLTSRILLPAGAVVLLSWMLGSSGHAAEQGVSQDAVKAAYLYRFSGYVEWPHESVAGHPFVIAVVDAPGVARELRRLMPERLLNQQPAQVREVTLLQELGGAQIVFVGAGHAEFLRAVAAGNRSMLLVTEDEKALDQGSMVNFVTIDKRVRFEVSLTAADRAGIKISSELLSVAIRVHGTRRQSDDLCIPFALPDEAQCGARLVARSSWLPVEKYLVQVGPPGPECGESVHGGLSVAAWMRCRPCLRAVVA